MILMNILAISSDNLCMLSPKMFCCLVLKFKFAFTSVHAKASMHK